MSDDYLGTRAADDIRTAMRSHAMPPPLETLRARVRQSVRHGALGAGAVGLLAILSVVAVLYWFPVEQRGGGVAAGGDTAVTGVQMHAVDTKLFYAAVTRCRTAIASCGTTFQVSTDRGVHWKIVGRPKTHVRTNARSMRDGLVVVDRRTVYLNGQVSRDGGRVWKDLMVRSVETPAREIEDHTLVYPHCGHRDDGSRIGVGMKSPCTAQLYVLNPRSGEESDLGTPPPMSLTINSEVQRHGDSVWVTGRVNDEGAVASSPDRGRTWSVVPLPGSAPFGVRQVLPTGNGRGFVVDYHTGVNTGETRIYRTDDGGASWQRLDHSSSEVRSRGVNFGVLHDQLWMVDGSGGLYVTRDGSSFSPAAGYAAAPERRVEPAASDENFLLLEQSVDHVDANRSHDSDQAFQLTTNFSGWVTARFR